MLLAHIVPGYFAARLTHSLWDEGWTKQQRTGLWIAAITSTIAPDADVVYNSLFRGFTNHSVLWTHSLFPHFVIAILWLIMPNGKRWSYLRTLVMLVAIGGVSHLVLDVIVHGTPLVYPFSSYMVGWPPQQVIDGGLWGYLTHPIFLLEPLLLSAAAIDCSRNRQLR